MSSIFASLALLLSAAVRSSKPKVKPKPALDRQALEAWGAATRGQLERQTDGAAETQAVEVGATARAGSRVSCLGRRSACL